MRVLLLLALLPAVAVAFAPMGPPNNPSWTHKKSLTTKVYSEDPTKVWYAEIANVVQNLLTNSPLNEGKKALVKALAGDYDEEATRAKLNGLIESEPVLMLSFTTWPFCVKAKALLDGLGAKYTVVELNVVEDGPALRAELGALTGRTSVPAVWIKGAGFVGGCNDGPRGGVNTLNDSGELDGLLRAAGAIA